MSDERGPLLKVDPWVFWWAIGAIGGTVLSAVIGFAVFLVAPFWFALVVAMLVAGASGWAAAEEYNKRHQP